MRASSSVVSRLGAIAIASFLTASLGCDGGMPPWNCKDPCPGSLKRDFFCNCYDPTDYKTKPPGSSGSVGSGTLHSACTCLLEDGNFESHFRFRPANFDNLHGHDVVVSAVACEDLTVCPDLDPAPGWDHIHQEFLQGRFRQRVELTRTYTGLYNPGQHWSIVGPRVSLAAIESDTGLRLASLQPADMPPDSPPLPQLDCEQHCSVGDEFCLRYALPTRYATPMRAVAARVLQSGGSSIPKSDLMSLFQQASDECNRSDLNISNSDVTNDGEECVMTAVVNPASGLAIRVLLPEHLTGRLTSDASHAFLAFNQPESSPIVAFNNEDFEFDFGGEVRSSWVRSDHLIVETYNGCSKVTF